MITARKYIVVNHFHGPPKRSDFEVVEFQLPSIQDNQILIKTEWVSVDPYHSINNHKIGLPYDQLGFQLGVVQETKDPRYKIGTKVISYKGWCNYAILNTEFKEDPLERIYCVSDIEGMSPSWSLGAIGITGATAYFGFLEICKPKPGETVVVTSAAGGVGSLVGQIAKLHGCKVIGFTGADRKVQWLEKELKFYKAFNYKKVNITEALEEAAPNGVDCYFDNVGGKISSLILKQMREHGRVSVCGSISSYETRKEHQEELPSLLSIISKQLKIEGFLTFRWVDRFEESRSKISQWIKSGEVKAEECVSEGFDNIFEAFSKMLKGENIGKTVVKI